MQILELPYPLLAYRFVDQDLLAVPFEERAHVLAHGCAVDVHADPGALEGEGGHLEFPGVRDDYRGVEEAVGAFFADVL